MILTHAKVPVIASIDGPPWAPLQTAKDNDIKVIAYDRMPTDTPMWTTHAPDNYKVAPSGRLPGREAGSQERQAPTP